MSAFNSENRLYLELNFKYQNIELIISWWVLVPLEEDEAATPDSGKNLMKADITFCFIDKLHVLVVHYTVFSR